MQKWEYAWLTYPGEWPVEFSHHQEQWKPIKGEKYSAVLKRLGDEGWELVSGEPGRIWFKRSLPE